MPKFLNLITYIDTSSNEQIIDLQIGALPDTVPLRDVTGGFKVGNSSTYDAADVANKQYFNNEVDALDFSSTDGNGYITRIKQENGKITEVTRKTLGGEVALTSGEQTIDGIKTFKARAKINSTGSGVYNKPINDDSSEWLLINKGYVDKELGVLSVSSTTTSSHDDVGDLVRYAKDYAVSSSEAVLSSSYLSLAGSGSSVDQSVTFTGDCQFGGSNKFKRILITNQSTSNNDVITRGFFNDVETNKNNLLLTKFNIVNQNTRISLQNLTGVSRINWGDGAESSVLPIGLVHNYSRIGQYYGMFYSVTSIGTFAFRDCNGLANVIIPDSVESIGSSAFYNCSGLTSLTIGNGVENIGIFAFYNCNGLANVIIPDSVESIGNSAFGGCSELMNVTIGNGVKSIGSSAFYNCSKLTSITIPDSVTSMGEGVFIGCPIEDATIPTLAITSIPKNNLKTVTITSGENIGQDAFSNCRSLESIIIGNSVTSIGGSAFYNCSSLTSITFNGTKTQWAAITKGSNWAYGTSLAVVHCTDGDLTTATVLITVAKGTVDKTQLSFTYNDYVLPQSATVTPLPNYAIQSITPSSDNIIIERLGRTFYISLRSFSPGSAYSIRIVCQQVA